MNNFPISIRSFILLAITLVLVLVPRFDRLDQFGLDAYSTEGQPASAFMAGAQKYSNHVRYFRGEAASTDLIKPWAYRPLPALIASFLPFDAMTSINVVNVLALLVGLFFLLKLFGILGFRADTSGLGGLLYTCSFPVFYYGSIGYIDPVLVGMVTVSTYLIFAKHHALFFISLLCGAFIKEAYIVTLPVLAVYQLAASQLGFWKTFAVSTLFFALFVLIIIGLRIFTPVGADFFWYPNPEMIQFNVFRLWSWLSFGLTFGIAGVLATYYLVKAISGLRSQPESLAIGFLGGLAIFVYSMLSAYADGRYFWTAYPFMIPLACLQLEKLRASS